MEKDTTYCKNLLCSRKGQCKRFWLNYAKEELPNPISLKHYNRYRTTRCKSFQPLTPNNNE